MITKSKAYNINMWVWIIAISLVVIILLMLLVWFIIMNKPITTIETDKTVITPGAPTIKIVPFAVMGNRIRVYRKSGAGELNLAEMMIKSPTGDTLKPINATSGSKFSVDGRFDPSKLIDGDFTTSARTAIDGSYAVQWLEVQFDQDVPIGSVELVSSGNSKGTALVITDSANREVYNAVINQDRPYYVWTPAGARRPETPMDIFNKPTQPAQISNIDPALAAAAETVLGIPKKLPQKPKGDILGKTITITSAEGAPINIAEIAVYNTDGALISDQADVSEITNGAVSYVAADKSPSTDRDINTVGKSDKMFQIVWPTNRSIGSVVLHDRGNTNLGGFNLTIKDADGKVTYTTTITKKEQSNAVFTYP